MARQAQRRLMVAASLFAAAGGACSVFAQEAEPPEAIVAPEAAAPAATQAAPAAPAAQPEAQPARPEDRRVGFVFKDTPFDQVLDYFSRTTGLPIVREAAVPAGAMTWVGGRTEYSFADALSILNLNLRMHGVMLRREENYLYLSTLADAVKKPSEVFDASLIPAGITPDQILTVMIPLQNSRATVVAEQIKPLLAPFGAVTAVEAQNMLILVETAAQCVRLRDVIGLIDAQRPVDSAFELFRLRHANAEQAVTALKGLVGQRVVKQIINPQDGKVRTLEEIDIAGLSLEADKRTNSVIAVGPEARLQTVRELITIIDVPGDGLAGDRQMMTFALETITPDEASQRLSALFASVPEESKPVVVPLGTVNKVSVVASPALLMQATALIGEIDPAAATGQARQPAAENVGRVVRLEHVEAPRVEQILSRMLTPRQQSAVRYTATPDGRGLLVSGPPADVAALEGLIAGLDVRSGADVDVRVVRIATGDPAAMLARAQELDAATGEAERDPVRATLDAASRTATLIGSRAGLARFEQLLRTAESAVVAEVESRAYALKTAVPSQLGQRVERLARPLLMPDDGSAYHEPSFEPLDELDTLVVRALPSQHGVLERLISQLDAEEPGRREFRVVPAGAGDPSKVRSRVEELLARLNEGLPREQQGRVEIEIDAVSGNLLVMGDAAGMQQFSSVIGQVQQLISPVREVRMIELKLASVRDVVAFLDEMASASESLIIQGGPKPVFEPIESTNSLLVAAQPSQLAVIEQLVRSVDARQAGERPPLRILRLRSTDAGNLAQVLQSSFDQRTPEERSKQPVSVRADDPTNTLIVSAHPDLLPEIEAIVEQLNETQALDAEGREIRIFPLAWARAEELAQTIDQMYPEPPMPIDPRTRLPRPDLRLPKEITVRADRATNSLIVDAPGKRLAGFEQIVRSLDQQHRGDDAEVRTYRLERADLEAVARTLRELSSSGAFRVGSRTPVTVSTEPATRSLVVSGPSAVFADVERVLQEIGQAPDRPATTLKMYALKHARAERLQPLLRDLLATRLRDEEERAGRSPAAADALLNVSSHEGSNTLIISAPEAIQQIAEELVRALDTEAAAAGRRVIRVTPLSYADASAVAQTLTATIPSMELPGGGDVRVIAATGSNALILSGAEADLRKVEELVAPLDVRPVDPQTMGVETFALEHADATQIAQTVERLLVQQQETDPRILTLQLRYARTPELFRRPTIRVEAEQRTNSLIVSAPAETLDLARTIIRRLDEPVEATGRVVETFTPARAAAGELAQTVARIVNQTVPQGRRAMELTPDARSGSIVAVGTQEQVAEAVRLMAEFDDRVPAVPQTELAVVELRHADARAVAGTVESLVSDRTRWPAELVRAERAGVSVASPRVNADAQANRLVISAPSVLVPMARQLVETLDQPAASRSVQVAVFRFERGQAATAAEALRAALTAQAQPGEPTPTVTPEPASNSVIVAASSERLAQAGELVREMDATVEPDRVSVRTVFLRHARAETVAPIVEQVLMRESTMEMLPEWQRWQYLLRGSDEERTAKVRVAAERRLNAVVVSASPATLELAEQVIAQLDAPPEGGPDGERLVRVIPLVNADATTLAQNLEAVFADEADGRQPPTIRVDAGGNALIVRATATQMQTVDRLARELDAATLTTSRQMRMIPIDRSRADAQLMAATLKRLLEQQGGVKVEIISTEELLEGGQGEEGKGESRSDAGFRPAPTLTGGPVGALAWAVGSAVFAQPEVQAEEPTVRIAVDPASNSLVVVGSPRLTERVLELARLIEQQMPAEPTSVRIVTLPSAADARAIQQLVSQTVNNVGRVSAENPGGFTGRVAVAPDPSETALIVWANDTDFQTVGRLIASLASLEAQRSLTVKIYPLANVTATGAVSAIQDLFQISPRGRQAQRLRGLDLTVVAPGEQPVRGAVDPAFVTVTPDPGGTSVIVAAPDEAIGLIDGLISLLDQSPVADRLAIRRYSLENARATELSPTLQQLFEAQRQGPGANDLPRARFIADDRTNSMLVTASASQHEEIVRLLAAADVRQAEDGLSLAILPLAHAQPSTVQRIVEQVLIGRDPGRRERIQISAEDQSGLLVVRASEEDLGDVRAVVAEVDTSKVADLPVRAIKLQNADAQTVSQALRQFYQDRAQATQRAGRRAGPGVAITGDRRSGTVVIAASDEDFEQLRSLASTFDEAAPSKEMRFNIVQLQHVRVTDIGDTITEIAWELQYERMPWFGGRQDAASEDKLFVSPNEHTNSIVVMGQGETMATMERIIAALDQPRSDLTALVVRAVPVRNADPQALANVIQRSMVTPGWRTWRGPDPDAVTVEVDRRRRTLILVGKGAKIEQAQAYIEQLDTASGRPDQVIESIRLEHAQADRAGNSLRQFFLERARAEGLPEDSMSIIGSRDGNVLLVSADPVSMAMVRDMVAQLDQPELGPDRRREMYYLQNTNVADAANVLREQFPATGRAEDRVIVTAQPSTNSLIVSAPGKVFAQVDGLVAMLDEVRQVGSIVTISLEKARVQEVVEALRAALPENLKVKITPVVRSNSIMLTGSDDAIAQVQEHVRRLDVEPEQQMQQFRVVRLEHALATDVRFTLNLLLRNRPRGTGEPDPSIDFNSIDNTLSILATPDQMRQITEMIAQLDVPSGPGRKTEFVKLEFADAEQTAKALGVFYGRFAAEATTAGARNATIIADPTSNSLVISADEGEWENIRALLGKLDTEEYDTSRQLVVIPLKHADATSVARALNEGFRAQIQDQAMAEQLRRAQDQANRGVRQDERAAALPPPVLVSAEGTPSVSAEVFTNSLIVSAGRQELLRIERVVEQLDVPGFAEMPEPTVIPIDAGKASQVASAIREMFQTDRIRRTGPGAVLVYGDDASNALIVRAEGTELAQIKALAQAIVSGSGLRVSPHVLRLTSIPAARLQQTIRATFTPAAQQLGETLSVEVDRTTNSLVIAASPGIYEQIERVVRELDTPAIAPEGVDQPIGAGGIAPGVFIIDVQHNSPEAVRQMLEQMGVTRPPQGDRPGVVSEPVTLIPLKTRQALAVIAGAHDGQVIVGLVRALDAAPADATQHAAVIQLRLASADALVQTLRAMLDPSQQASGSSQAAALVEHVRRLNLRPTGLDEGRLELDLSKPIRLVPDVQSNAVVIASTEANVRVMESVVRSLDTLPIGDSVVVRIFPLENSAAVRVRGIIEQLFSQGEALRRLPGTQRRGLPVTTTGQALAGEIAVSVDERTNALIVAGREEAVALVEVLIRDLDDDRAERWVEPTIIRLEHADARTVAATLRSVLVDSAASTPEIAALRNQAARLRMVQRGGDPMDPASRIESDIFAPLVGLSITPETDLNSIIVVGTPANLRLVNELVAQLDVELAAAGNLVRFFPLKHALADRVGAIIGDVFRQREQAGSLRQEDRLVISSDLRTNSLIVATSQRSFEVVGSLIESLDTADASYSVGLHVIPVPDGNVTQLAASLERLMRDRIAATQRAGSVQSPADVFSIVPDATNNLLILACSDENLQLVKDFIEALRNDANAILRGERVALIQLKAARAADAVQSINSLYVQRENERRGPGSVLVVPNPRLNALIVSGTQEDVNVIRGLVERLDTNEIATVQDVRRIELKSANAIEVVQLIQGVLAGRSLSGAAGGQAVRLRYFRDQVAEGAEGLAGREMTEAEVDDFIREQVRITPDLRTNSVMVAAPTQIVDLVSAIVSDLDMSRAGSRKIEHYRLVNADARAMATLLRDLFNLQQQGDRLVLIPTGLPGAEDDPTLSGLGRTNVTAVPDVRQELSITIDARTNSLLVSGTEEYLELVGDVVRELDSIQANEREQMVVHLANARAMDVEQTLQGYFQSEADRLQRTLSAEMQGSASRQLENEVTIVGDEKSNKLLISASPRYLDTVERIVRELDAAPPQVMIQVLLAEVSLDAENTWGFDVRVGGDTGLGNDAYKIGVFAAGTGVSSAIGTPNIAVSSLDFELLIRALEVQGKLEVLSRPQVTVRNNEIARIQVGEDIGLVSAFDRSDTGNVRSDVERREIGIILQVVPTISPDGFVRMDIRPEISTLSQREIQISENLSSPVINVRKVETTVAVMDGQTVVIGGLIQTTAEERENRIPFFGHLPVVGGLFRSNVMQNQKTELLVILTPRIVPGGSGSIERYQRLSDGEIMRISDPQRVIDALDDTEVPKRLSPQPMDEFPADAPKFPADRRPGEPDADSMSPVSSGVDWESVPRFPADRARREETTDDGR